MSSKTTGTRKYLIWGSVLVLAGIGGYVIFKRRKDAKAKEECSKNGGTWDEATKTCSVTAKIEEVKIEEKKEEEKKEEEKEEDKSNDPATGLSKTDGDAFRAWVNTTYPAYAKEIKLDKTGPQDNPTIRKGFAKYGTEWKNSKSGKISILPTNADSFTKLAASLKTPIYTLSDGNRYTYKPFNADSDSTIGWRITFFEQASGDTSKQSFKISNQNIFTRVKVDEYSYGYWNNNGKSMRVTIGANKGTQSTTDSVQKTVEAIIGKKIKFL